MTEEMITRGPLKGLEMSVPWMLTSGVRIESGHPARQIVQDGIQLYVVGADRTALRLDLDVHDAGDLHQALEAHMENVAATGVQPMTPEERRRALRTDKTRKANLNAIQEEIDNPIRPCTCGARKTREACTCPHRMTPSRALASFGDHALVSDVDPEFLAAMEAVLEAWTGPHRWQGPGGTDPAEVIRSWAPELAAALDGLAALNA